MHKLVVLYGPPTDPTHFREYYVASHLPLVDRIPGLRGRRYSFDVVALAGASPYFAVFEADFDDADAMTAALATSAGQAATADVPNYATGGATILHYPVR